LAYRGFIFNCLERKEESEKDWNLVEQEGNMESKQLITNWQRIMESSNNLAHDDGNE
jgi:hypothetical protein